MKRTFFLVLLGLLVNIGVYPQIQRKFLGFTFGVTTKNQVINFAKVNKKEYRVMSNDDVYVKDIKFGGIKWNMVAFSFFHNKFYIIYFSDSEENTPRTNLDVSWNNLKSSLNAKYYNFYNIEESSETDYFYDDGRTRLKASYDYYQGYKGISLMYYDYKLFVQKLEEDDNEL